MTPVALPDLLFEQAALRPQKAALFYKTAAAPVYAPITYQDLAVSVMKTALGLKAIGLGKGDAVSILSGNRPEWVMADMGILMCGAASVPIYTTLSPAEIVHIVTDSQSKILIVETLELFTIVRPILGRCPTLCHVILIQGDLPVLSNISGMGWEELRHIGANAEPFESDALKIAYGNIASDDVASIVYTSGTTGPAKGVMLTHGNFLSNIADILECVATTHEDVVLSFLPLSHAFERTVGYYCVLSVGASIYYAESINTVSRDMLEAQPTILISVPRLYEKIQARLYDQLTGIKKPIFDWATNVAKQHLVRPTPLNTLQYKLADAFIFNKIRKKTGGKLRFFVSGGAPLSKELGEFFLGLGLLIVEGYGMTETSPVIACNRPDHYKIGTVGLPLPNMSVKLADDGELIVKGPNVMNGYFNRNSATQEIIDADGWLHTGDIAKIDSDGFIRIIDRKKELIVLSNGKKVAPLVIEEALKTSRYISQVMVIGDQHHYLTALIVPNFSLLAKFWVKKGLLFQDPVELISQADITQFFTSLIDEKLTAFAPYEHIKKFTLLPVGFSQENGELTPTLKFKRKIIEKRYKSLIDSLYLIQKEVPHDKKHL